MDSSYFGLSKSRKVDSLLTRFWTTGGLAFPDAPQPSNRSLKTYLCLKKVSALGFRGLGFRVQDLGLGLAPKLLRKCSHIGSPVKATKGNIKNSSGLPS